MYESMEEQNKRLISERKAREAQMAKLLSEKRPKLLKGQDLNDGRIWLVSYMDARNTTPYDHHDGRGAQKAYCFHTQLYGELSCHVERDGVELDPVEDLI